jgi:hypothetical protein
MLCLGLGIAWTRATIRWRRVLLILTLYSVFVTLIVVSTSSQLAMQDRCPILHSSWPEFWAGHMAGNRESMLLAREAGSDYGAFNVGELMGLDGLGSLVLLWVIWGVAAGLWMRFRPGAGGGEIPGPHDGGQTLPGDHPINQI